MNIHSSKQHVHIPRSLRNTLIATFVVFSLVVLLTAMYMPRTASAHYYRPYSSTVWVFPSSRIATRSRQPQLFDTAPTLFMEGKTWTEPQYPPEPVVATRSNQPQLFDTAPTLFMEGKTWTEPQYPPEPVVPQEFKVTSDTDTHHTNSWSNWVIPRAFATEAVTESNSASLTTSAIATAHAAAPDTETQEMLTVTKTSTAETVMPGDLLTYRIVVTNNTDESISDITVMDHVSSHTHPDAATPRAQVEDNAAWWDEQTIPPEGMTYFLRVRVDETVPDDAILENKVEVWGPDIHISTTDTTSIATIDTVDSTVSPTANTGPGIGALLLVTIATIASGIGAITVRKLFA